MKIFSLSFALFFVSSILAQPDTTFTELRGMEDVMGQTHLFYRKHAFITSQMYHDDVYHLDLFGGTDTLFLRDYYEYWSGDIVEDFEFWENDPFRYIYGGAYLSIDPVAYINSWSTMNLFLWVGFVNNVEISQQDDSLLYASVNGDLIRSSDGGLVWSWIALNQSFPMVALSPFDDQVLFGVVGDFSGKLYKSVDGGTTSFMVDSSISWIENNTQLFFDKDSVHIYAVTRTPIKSHFLRSEDSGDSWQLMLSDSLTFHLTIDNSQSGAVFLSIGHEIFSSNDYGITFTPYWSLSRPVVEMYKKPQSDLLYAITAKTLYEITPIDTQAIIRLSTITGVVEPRQPIQDFRLFQNYPNPFNPSTTISYQLPANSEIELIIYNLLGQRIRTLVNSRQPAGVHKVRWYGKDDTGLEAASGIYIYRLKAGKFVRSKKMLLLR